MSKRFPHIVLSLFIFITACVPPAHMHRRGGILYKDTREKIVRTAKSYIGIKYRWGGTTQFGFDCSGFVQHVYKKNGINLPRGSRSQYYKGRRISLVYAEPGDLVFFRINGSKISHVGIYLGNYEFIHSPRSGKKISRASINNSYWKKRYAGAVTYL